MTQQQNPFPYFVGVQSLHMLAHKHSRVCVMNIHGKESSVVTPVSHKYSHGNIVAGVQYGRSGEDMETDIGIIPVFGSVREVLEKGIEFDTGVIYLPPTAVAHAVSELTTQNEHLEKIVIITEKISVRDSRLIRLAAQKRGVDVFGANCLGIANPWDHVRTGGALGGDNPIESLKKGSIAIYSNSGNFSTTISEYLKTAGFGTSTILSSGKDVYIQFALAEFLYCAENDPRTKAIVVYVEPGGYYEKNALDWVLEERFKLTKPIIACVTGRWKSNLTRSCGHAGAVAGSGDDAIAKEKWFDDFFGVGLFDPANPKVSKRGVRIRSIQEVPTAATEIMKQIGEEPDFKPIGDLNLKPWFVSDQDVDYPSHLRLDKVKAVSPYNEQIEKVSHLVGAQYQRETMRNKSSVSFLNPKTQVTELHGISLLDLVPIPFAKTCFFALLKSIPEDSQLPLINVILNYFVSLGTENNEIVTKTRKNGGTPNAYLGAGLLTAGGNHPFHEIRCITSILIDLFHVDTKKDLSISPNLIKAKLGVKIDFPKGAPPKQDEQFADYLIDLIQSTGQANILTQFAMEFIRKEKKKKQKVNAANLIIAAVLLSLSWPTLTNRKIARKTVEDLSEYLAMNGYLVGCSCFKTQSNSFWKKLKDRSKFNILETDFSETCFRVLFNRQPESKELFSLNSMLNLTVTNGPGTISAKGAKESISAKNPISTAYVGFLTNTGLAHGGNGYEAISYLLGVFQEFDPYQAKKKDLGPKLKQLAMKSAETYLHYKKKAKAEGDLQYAKIPCINHPVFKGKAVNIDKREAFIRALFKKNKMTNSFQEYYHHLVEQLFEIGATRNVFCVNIDAVISTISLDLFWQEIKSEKITETEMKDIVFILFLFARMAGISAEIADHLSRGTDMDCRTPLSLVGYIS
ncbi:MAG: CoA-binding protein [Deltaproteobacteria bacterium]|jgi:succinyl-CoA synthetase alpha subunit|nr:CoA-binding protein [Deltaproteobacteria bacterium]